MTTLSDLQARATKLYSEMDAVQVDFNVAQNAARDVSTIPTDTAAAKTRRVNLGTTIAALNGYNAAITNEWAKVVRQIWGVEHPGVPFPGPNLP